MKEIYIWGERRLEFVGKVVTGYALLAIVHLPVDTEYYRLSARLQEANPLCLPVLGEQPVLSMYL